jgi:hypothetical protein
MKNFISDILDLLVRSLSTQVLILIIIIIFRKKINDILSSFSFTISRVSAVKGLEFTNLSQDTEEFLDKKPKKLDKKDVEKWYKFEKIYRVIYGSQILFLDQINSFSSVNNDIALKEYNKAKEYYSESYKTINFEHWISFLIKRGLCEYEGSTLKITELGTEFLAYLIQNGISKTKIL